MRILRSVDSQFWLQVARKCDYATFFHTPFWQTLATQTYRGYRDATIGAELESGVRLVIPLLASARGLSSFFPSSVSTFAGCYGGLIADGPVTLAARMQLYTTVLRHYRLGHLEITGNPLAAENELPAPFEERRDFTHLLTLDGDYDTISRRFSKAHRRATTKGYRMGLKTRLAVNLSDYHAYYAAYQDSLRRWGPKATSRYPWQLFHRGYDLARTLGDHIKLWLVELDGTVLAGAWVFYWNQHAAYWHGAAHAEWFPYKPTHVLHADIIRNACEQGYKYYDFNPSGGHEGVATFKQRFGAAQRPISRYSYSNRWCEAINRLLAKLRG